MGEFRSDDFQSAEDYAEIEAVEPNYSANNNKTAEMTNLLDEPVLHREGSRNKKKMVIQKVCQMSKFETCIIWKIIKHVSRNKI